MTCVNGCVTKIKVYHGDEAVQTTCGRGKYVNKSLGLPSA
jgi:hypothetical protein